MKALISLAAFIAAMIQTSKAEAYQVKASGNAWLEGGAACSLIFVLAVILWKKFVPEKYRSLRYVVPALSSLLLAYISTLIIGGLEGAGFITYVVLLFAATIIALGIAGGFKDFPGSMLKKTLDEPTHRRQPTGKICPRCNAPWVGPKFCRLCFYPRDPPAGTPHQGGGQTPPPAKKGRMAAFNCR